MWKSISGVPKVVDNKKNEKKKKKKRNPKAVHDNSWYEGIQEYKDKEWEVAWLWLKHDEEKGMICKWCVENKKSLVAQNVLN